jgi:hypothetical protein
VIFQLLPTEEAKQEGAKDPEEMFKSTHADEAKDNETKADEYDDDLD